MAIPENIYPSLFERFHGFPDNLYRANGCLAVTEGIRPVSFPGQHLLCRVQNPAAIGTSQVVTSGFQSFWPLGIISQGDTRHLQYTGLFLHPA